MVSHSVGGPVSKYQCVPCGQSGNCGVNFAYQPGDLQSLVYMWYQEINMKTDPILSIPLGDSNTQTCFETTTSSVLLKGESSQSENIGNFVQVDIVTLGAERNKSMRDISK